MADRAPLRARIKAGEQLTGAILRVPNLMLVELTGLTGMDFLVLDCEHGPADGLEQHLVAAASVGIPVLVRIGGDSSAEVLRVLDLGATGLVVPHVSDAERAAWAVAAACYPPRGRRGFAVYTRAGHYGLATTTEHLAAAAQDTVVVAMIEDRAGCENVDRIAAVEGVDAIFVGPGDLAVDLGATDVAGLDRLTEAIDGVAGATHRAGRALMTIVTDEAAARRARESGTTLVVHNLQAAVTALVQRLAASGEAPSPSTDPSPAHQGEPA